MVSWSPRKLLKGLWVGRPIGSGFGWVYRFPSIYRLVMSVLYRDWTGRRFEACKDDILSSSPSHVVEFCFGSLEIAEFCKANKLSWSGFDLNPASVARARKAGFFAEVSDVTSLDISLDARCHVVLNSSLYHFREALPQLANSLISVGAISLYISEPVENLSSRGGIFTRLSVASTMVAGKQVAFRYSSSELRRDVEFIAGYLGWSLRSVPGSHVRNLDFRLDAEPSRRRQ